MGVAEGVGTGQNGPMRMGDAEVRRFIHDIRNPIGALIGFAHLLKTRDDKLSDEQRSEVLDSISRTSERLSKMVEEFADAHEAQSQEPS